MSRTLIFIVIFSLSGCVESNGTIHQELDRSNGLHFSECESARNREYVSSPNGDRIDGWSAGRANPLLEVADIEFWKCKKIEVGDSTHIDEEFAIFYRFNQDPPDNCLRHTERLPAVLQAILVESNDLKIAMQEKLDFDKIFVGQVSTPNANEYTEFSWSMGGQGGRLSGEIRLAEPYENELRNEFFWQIGSGLGHLVVEFSTINKSTVDSVSSGEISWPETMVNPTGTWFGTAGYYADMKVASSVFEYETQDCENQRQVA